MYEHSRRTLTIASLAVLATFLDTTILYVAFPDITATFSETGASELSWVLNAYTIVFAALLIPAGKLADRVGHRKVFLTGSVVFTVASMACGLAPSAELLIAFRVVQAVGAAALIPSSLALVMHAFAHDQLPRAVAIWGAAGAVAGALGPTLGAAIVEGLGWRWAFFINLPVGIYTVIAGRRSLHESSDPATQVPSLVGVILIAGAAGLLSYGLVGTEQFGWLSTRTFGVLVAGLVVLVVFVIHQQHTNAPALDLDLFRIPNFRWANVAMFSGPRSPRCSSVRSCSSPTSGAGRCCKPGSGSPPDRSSSASSHPGPASSPARSGSDRCSSPAASCTPALACSA
jgi:EmrB/QacA subfamily drug resistance transporter